MLIAGGFARGTVCALTPDRLLPILMRLQFLAEVVEWQTRRSQTPLSESSWGFDSPLRHHG